MEDRMLRTTRRHLNPMAAALTIVFVLNLYLISHVQAQARDFDNGSDSAASFDTGWPDVHFADSNAPARSLTSDDGFDASESFAGETDSGLGDLDELLNVNIEQLSQTDVVVPGFSEEVSTVAREESTVGRSPAAVYVITGEMIRRSGYRSIPESLRLAPGVQVAKLDSNKWSISIRGFNGRFSNKLLVQIDGRSVYTPLFAGVFWDVQDVLLEDVDRIEVIRGPGASLWGSNAVNGIINVITKNAHETRGLFVEGGGGNQRDFGSARIGGRKGKVSWRTYGKWFDRGAGFSPDGNPNDDWEIGRAGFRTDWKASCCDTVTVQGDYYDGTAGQTQQILSPTAPFSAVSPSEHEVAGGNALFRWSRKINDQSDWSFQAYYDRTERYITEVGFGEDRDTVDLDFQYRFPWRQDHSVIVGAGYRNTRDQIDNSSFQIMFRPDSRSADTFNTYVQDQITLRDDLLFLTIGSKFSWNDYTGFEIQPTARVLYTPSKRRSIWASVSRAVRTPSRAEDDIYLLSDPRTAPVNPTFALVLGNRGIESEQLLAWEMGVRSSPIDELFWDLALFYHQYDDLTSVGSGTPGIDPISGEFVLPLPFINGVEGDGYGFELASTAMMLDNWTLRSGYSYLRVDLDANSEVFDVVQGTQGDPRNQFFFHSSWDIGCNWELDLIGRYVDVLRLADTPSYFELDSRIGWSFNDNVELSLVGRNLLDGSHKEFGSDTATGTQFSEVRRELYGVIALRY